MLKNWINCILIITVMVGIIEVIVPEGETKKFVFLITRISVSIVIALPILKLAKTNKFHDRFIVIDNKEMYHLGASIKDLGKKCFGINRIEDIEIIEKIIRV